MLYLVFDIDTWGGGSSGDPLSRPFLGGPPYTQMVRRYPLDRSLSRISFSTSSEKWTNRGFPSLALDFAPRKGESIMFDLIGVE